MENKQHVISIFEAEKLGKPALEKKYGKDILLAKFKGNTFVLEYSDYFPLEQLYTPLFRANADGKYVYFERVSSR